MTNVPRRGTGEFADVVIVETKTETPSPSPSSPRHLIPVLLRYGSSSPLKPRYRRRNNCYYLLSRRRRPPSTSTRRLLVALRKPLLLVVFVALIHLDPFAEVLPMVASGFTLSSSAPRWSRPAYSTTVVPAGGWWWCRGGVLGGRGIIGHHPSPSPRRSGHQSLGGSSRLGTTGPHLRPPFRHPFVLARHCTSTRGLTRSSSSSLDSLDDRPVPARHSSRDDDDEMAMANGADDGRRVSDDGEGWAEGDRVSSEDTNTLLLFGRIARLLEAMPMRFPTSSRSSSSSSSSQQKPLYVERGVGGGYDSGGGGGGVNGGAASLINLKLVMCGRNFATTGKADEASKAAATNEDHFTSSSPLPPVLVSPRTKVPGCVATVHVRTTLVPIIDQPAPATASPPSTVEGEDDSVGDGTGGSEDGGSAMTTTRDPHRYGVVVDGTADAAVSRGLLSLLSASFGPDVSSIRRTFGEADPISSGGDEADRMWFPTAADVLEVDADRAAELLGLRDVLSRGRNDGVASLVRVVQNQVRSLLLLSDPSHPERQGASSRADDATATTAAATKMEGSTDDITIAEAKVEANGIASTGRKGDRRKVKVAMLLSGGVDSSVALALLASDPTYDVTAFYLRIWLEDELSHLGQCPWEDDWNICREVCDYVGRRIAGMDGPIPLEAVSMQEEYVEAVLGYTLDEARRGRTPNPDVWCNARIKFGCFYDAVTLRSPSCMDGEEGYEEEGFDYVATGHYASVVPVTDDGQGGGDEGDNGRGRRVRLLRAPDPVKDQTYFLSALSQDQLSRAMFPLGNYTKAEVRELADRFGLPNRNRPDSQGLCFLGKVKFDDFLGSYLGERMGDVVDADTGDVIGRHRGLWFHTVGQRKGLGKVLFRLRTAEGPWYVVAKDPERNALFASNRYNDVDVDVNGDGAGVGADEGDALATARLECHVEDVRWISGMEPAHLFSDGNCFDGDGAADAEGHGGGRVVAGRFGMKVRHGPTIVEGWLELLREDEPSGDGCDGTRSCGRIRLDSRDGGLAPGQFVAFYEPDGGTECLGSAVISERHWARFLASGSGALRYGRGHAG